MRWGECPGQSNRSGPGFTPAAGALGNDVEAASVSVAVAPQQGTLALAEDGGFTYTPEAGYAGDDSFVDFGRLENGEQSLAVVTLTARDATPPVVAWDAPTALGVEHGYWLRGRLRDHTAVRLLDAEALLRRPGA